MHSFPHGDEMRHDRDSNLSTEEAYDVKKSRESESVLRLRQPTGKKCLQNDGGNQTDESKGLADAREQFGAIEIRRRPRTGVARVENRSHGATSESRRHQKPRIKPPKK